MKFLPTPGSSTPIQPSIHQTISQPNPHLRHTLARCPEWRTQVGGLLTMGSKARKKTKKKLYTLYFQINFLILLIFTTVNDNLVFCVFYPRRMFVACWWRVRATESGAKCCTSQFRNIKTVSLYGFLCVGWRHSLMHHGDWRMYSWFCWSFFSVLDTDRQTQCVKL